MYEQTPTLNSACCVNYLSQFGHILRQTLKHFIFLALSRQSGHVVFINIFECFQLYTDLAFQIVLFFKINKGFKNIYK